MRELTLTKHFVQRWMERVGNWPTTEAVQHFMRQSVRVQPCRDLLCQDGRNYRVLAIYWHPDLDLVIKVDTVDWAAVTVMTRDNWQGDDDAQAGLLPCVTKSTPISERAKRIRQLFGRRRQCA